MCRSSYPDRKNLVETGKQMLLRVLTFLAALCSLYIVLELMHVNLYMIMWIVLLSAGPLSYITFRDNDARKNDSL